MTAPKFPDEPIRGMPEHVRELTPAEVDEAAQWDEYDDLDERDCWTCGGDGYHECEEWDCLHPKGNGTAHVATCPNCHGSGASKDVWYW